MKPGRKLQRQLDDLVRSIPASGAGTAPASSPPPSSRSSAEVVITWSTAAPSWSPSSTIRTRAPESSSITARSRGVYIGFTGTTTASLPLSTGTSHWYVIARLAGDCPPLVSAERTFTVSESGNCGTHGVPQFIAPAPGSTQTSPVAFSWMPVPGAIGYRLWIEANVKETDLTHVHVGQKARVVLDTYPDETWDGEVSSISPAAGSEFGPTISFTNGPDRRREA